MRCLLLESEKLTRPKKLQDPCATAVINPCYEGQIEQPTKQLNGGTASPPIGYKVHVLSLCGRYNTTCRRRRQHSNPSSKHVWQQPGPHFPHETSHPWSIRKQSVSCIPSRSSNPNISVHRSKRLGNWRYEKLARDRDGRSKLCVSKRNSALVPRGLSPFFSR